MALDANPKDSGKIWTPSNIITLFRIFLVPVFAIALITPWPEWLSIHDVIDGRAKAWISAIIFIAISCTDWIDGYLARKRNEVTDFGKFLDPLADKILVAAALIALVELDVLPSWPALIILAREFIVSGIRMLAASKGYVIAASWYGKAKTVLQIVAIVLFIVKGNVPLDEPGQLGLYVLAWAVMVAALVMTIVSMMDYIAKARPLLFPKADCAREGAEQLVSPSEGCGGGADPTACEICTGQSTDISCIDSMGERALRDAIAEAAKRVVDGALRGGVHVGAAESLTGGMVGAAVTSVPGSSSVVNGSLVTYTNEMKHALLGVSCELLDADGAVSESCAKAMARGAAQRLGVDVAVSVTGIAGPGGAEEGKPVGTVFMGVCAGGRAECSRLLFGGNRQDVRLKTTLAALCALESKVCR